MNLLVRNLNGRSLCLSYPDHERVSVAAIKESIWEREGIPTHLQQLRLSASALTSAHSLSVDEHDGCELTLSLALLGGKGGFGSLLKKQAAKAGQKLTTDTSACRDLNGRRLRHVQAEQKILEWERKQEELKAANNGVLPSLSARERVQRYQNINNNKPLKRSMCKFGDACKYQHKCRFEHPNEKAAQLLKFKMTNLSRSFGAGENYTPEAAVDGEEMMSAVELGLLEAKRSVNKRKRSRRDDAASDGEDNSDDNDDESDDSDDGSKSRSKKQRKNIAKDTESSDSDDDDSDDDDFDDTLFLSLQSNGFHKPKPHTATCKLPKTQKANPTRTQVSKTSSTQKDTSKGKQPTSSLSPPSPSPSPSPSSKEQPHANGNGPKESGSSSSSSPSSPSLSSLSSPSPSFDISRYGSKAELLGLGADVLKIELTRLGLKAGGTTAMRADRLWLLKTTPLGKLARKHFAKKK